MSERIMLTHPIEGPYVPRQKDLAQLNQQNLLIHYASFRYGTDFYGMP